MFLESPDADIAMEVATSEQHVSEAIYDCVICGQSGPSTEDRPTGLVVLLQASSGMNVWCVRNAGFCSFQCLHKSCWILWSLEAQGFLFFSGWSSVRHIRNFFKVWGKNKQFNSILLSIRFSKCSSALQTCRKISTGKKRKLNSHQCVCMQIDMSVIGYRCMCVYNVQVQKNNFQYLDSLVNFYFSTSTKRVIVTNQNCLIVFLMV